MCPIISSSTIVIIDSVTGITPPSSLHYVLHIQRSLLPFLPQPRCSFCMLTGSITKFKGQLEFPSNITVFSWPLPNFRIQDDLGLLVFFWNLQRGLVLRPWLRPSNNSDVLSIESNPRCGLSSASAEESPCMSDCVVLYKKASENNRMKVEDKRSLCLNQFFGLHVFFYQNM